MFQWFCVNMNILFVKFKFMNRISYLIKNLIPIIEQNNVTQKQIFRTNQPRHKNTKSQNSDKQLYTIFSAIYENVTTTRFRN